MSLNDIFGILSVVALGFLSFGVLKQWRLVSRTGSTANISTTEVTIRVVVTVILLIKILLTGDLYLSIGQSLLATVLVIYYIHFLHLRTKEKQS